MYIIYIKTVIYGLHHHTLSQYYLILKGKSNLENKMKTFIGIHLEFILDYTTLISYYIENDTFTIQVTTAF